MNTTYLNAFHHAEGGNMVNFAGWEMPINYGSQINEHNLVRQQVGVLMFHTWRFLISKVTTRFLF